MEKLIEEFSFGLFFWQTLIFVGLVLLLGKFAWKPILNAVNEREQGIKDALDAAAKAQEDMAQLNASNEKLLQQARQEREQMLFEARQFKDKLMAEAKEQAQAEGEKLLAQAQAVIEGEKKAAVEDLKKQVASYAIEIAEKLLKSELSAQAKQDQLVENLVKEIKIN
jgi:F-type H+-transporting ATPase subunit b